MQSLTIDWSAATATLSIIGQRITVVICQRQASINNGQRSKSIIDQCLAINGSHHQLPLVATGNMPVITAIDDMPHAAGIISQFPARLQYHLLARVWASVWASD